MAARLAGAHLVIGRAGASTVCELAVSGKPSILVPLKIAADDHQTYNAKLLADAGAAEVLPEKEFTPEALGAIIERLLSDQTAARPGQSVARPTRREAGPTW